MRLIADQETDIRHRQATRTLLGTILHAAGASGDGVNCERLCATRFGDLASISVRGTGRLLVKGRLFFALDFPQFTDGRAFSQARVLRHRLGFEGELRALGNVLVDQAAFMTRCGIDAFEVWGEQDLVAWQRIMGSVTRVYQPGYRAGELGLIGRRTGFSRS